MSSIKTENIATISLLGITVLAGILFTLPTVSAETEAVDTVTITVPSACSMSGTITTGNEHIATVDSGTYVADIGETTLKTICNDSNGFSIYVIGYTNDTYGNTVLKSSLGDTSNVITGTATSGNTSNWAMKLTTVSNDYTPTILSDTNGSFSSYHIIPSTYTKVATKDSVTDATNGSNIKTTYAVYMNPTQPAGTYEGKVKYTLVHPASEGAPTVPVSIADAEYMQDVDTCPTTLTTEQVYTLKDSRDNQEYKVAKLADGKCWMVENLNLAGGTTLDAEKTDVTSEYITNYTAGDSRLAKTDGKLVLPASDTAGFNTDNYSYVYNSGNKTNCGASGQNTPCYSYYSWDAATLGSGRSISTDNTDAPYSICPKGWRLPTSGGVSSNGWKRGDFYALATAYGANLESNYYDSSTDTGANFYNNAGPGTTPSFLLAGSYRSGSFRDGGSYGNYWSATSRSSTSDARNLGFDSRGVYPADNFDRHRGFSVRCVFSE